jgi:hypothetical protein
LEATVWAGMISAHRVFPSRLLSWKLVSLKQENWLMKFDQKNGKLTASLDAINQRRRLEFMVFASYAVRWRQSGKGLPP